MTEETEAKEELKRQRNLDGLIRFWGNKLKSMKAYLSPSEEALIKATITQLRRLEELDDKTK